MHPKSFSVIDLTDEGTPKKQTRNEEIEEINSITSDLKSLQDVAIVRTLKTNGVDTETLGSSSPVANIRRGPRPLNRRSTDDISVVKAVKVSKPRRRTVPAAPTNQTSSSEETIVSDSTKRCPVCFDVLRKPSVTLCGHVYCTECILAVVRSTKQCPICRKKLTQRGFHPLYL